MLIVCFVFSFNKHRDLKGYILYVSFGFITFILEIFENIKQMFYIAPFKFAFNPSIHSAIFYEQEVLMWVLGVGSAPSSVIHTAGSL